MADIEKILRFGINFNTSLVKLRKGATEKDGATLTKEECQSVIEALRIFVKPEDES